MGFEKKAAQSQKGNCHAKKGQRDDLQEPRQQESHAEHPVSTTVSCVCMAMDWMPESDRLSNVQGPRRSNECVNLHESEREEEIAREEDVEDAHIAREGIPTYRWAVPTVWATYSRGHSRCQPSWSMAHYQKQMGRID